MISPAYVGTKGTHLQVLMDRNQIPIASATFDQSRRPYERNPRRSAGYAQATFRADNHDLINRGPHRL